MAEASGFAHLVSLACHDLRTPLATVAGFAGTLSRDDALGQPAARYVGMIEAAAAQLGGLIDDLALAARIEAGRYEPTLEVKDTLDLVRAAAERLGVDRAGAGGDGSGVTVDPEPIERALAALAWAALRHGSLERVELEAAGTEARIHPITRPAAAIVLAEDLRDLGAAVGLRVVDALGGSVNLEGDILRVALPPANEGASRAADP